MQNNVFQIEKLRKFTLYGVLLILTLIIALILLLQTAYIQTKITKFVVSEISKELHSDIEIGNVKISLFRGFVFKNIYIQDQEKDTLIFAKEISLIPNGLQINYNDLSMKEVSVKDLYVNLYEIEKDSLNVQYLIDALKLDNKKDSDNNFNFYSQKVLITNSKFSYKENDSIYIPGVNLKDLKFDSINSLFLNFSIKNEKIKSEIDKISFTEKSGFKLSDLSSKKILVNPKQIHLKELVLKTPSSELAFDSLNVDFPAKYKLQDYKNDLKANISIQKHAYISYNDINFFTSDTVNYSGKLQVSGNINGSYNSFIFNDLELKYGSIINLKLDSDVKNLDFIENTLFNVNIKRFNIDFKKIKTVKIPFIKSLLSKLPDAFTKVGEINYTGTTKGRFSDFTSIGEIYGEFGGILINTNGTKDSLSLINLNGQITATEIDASKIFGVNNFGKTSFNQEFALSISKNKKLKLKTFGKINELNYKDIRFSNIDVYTTLNDKKIDSLNININQKEIKAHLIAKVDFSFEVPIVKFDCMVEYAYLKHFGLDKKNNDSKINFSATADFKGLNIDDFIGNIRLKSPFVISKNSLAFRMNKLNLVSSLSTKKDSVKTINLESDIVDLKIITKDKTSEILAALENLTEELLKPESIKQKTYTDISSGYLNFEVNIKQPEFISNLFFPDYHISPETKIIGLYDPAKKYLNLSLNSNKLKYKNIIVNDFYLIAYTGEGKLFGGIGGSSFLPSKNIKINNISIEGDLHEETINYNLRWDNFKDSANYSANIVGFIEMNKNISNSYNCKINNSEIIMNNVPWKFNNASVLIDSTRITIVDLKFENNGQQIYLDGNISKYPGDILFAEYKNFEISNLQPILEKDISFSGKLFGSTTFAHLYDDLLIFTDDSISNLNVNNIDFGNFYFKSKWDDLEGKIHSNAYNLKGRHKQFMNDTIYGDYFPETEKMDFKIDIRSMSLKMFKDYYSEYVRFNPSSYFAGLVNVSGHIKKPEISGNLKIKQTSAHIEYLNTNYNFEDINISISPKNIRIAKTYFSEKEGGTAFLKGHISHNNFSEFKLDVDLKTENLKIMELERAESSSFYGTAFGTGDINFSGLLNDIKLNADIKTDENTKIFIPISSNEQLEGNRNFIRFVTDTTITKSKKEKYVADYSGFSMIVKLDVTPDAEIHINPNESGTIYTKGEGALNLTLNKEGDFNMSGAYTILDGTYELELVRLPKIFRIKEGGKIVFNGAPEDAEINISAYYELNNVVLNGLYPDIERESIDKSNVICSVNLTETLVEPKLSLKIDLPENSDSEYADKLQSFNEKEINEQFLALLLLKKFYNFNNIEGVSDATKPLGGDIIAGQLNDVLEKFSKDIEIIIDYNPGELNKSDEYGVQVAGKFLDDRIEYRFGGGYGGKENIAGKNEKIVGEVEIEYKINKKGNIRGKFYNKANDNLDDEGNYKQGVGFVLKGKFDSFFFWKHKDKGKMEEDTIYENN